MFDITFRFEECALVATALTGQSAAVAYFSGSAIITPDGVGGYAIEEITLHAADAATSFVSVTISKHDRGFVLFHDSLVAARDEDIVEAIVNWNADRAANARADARDFERAGP